MNSLFKHNWTKVDAPAAGHHQWEALDAEATHPDPFIPNKFRRPTMLTSDIALIHDESYKNISQAFRDDFDYFTEKFAQAWCMCLPYISYFYIV